MSDIIDKLVQSVVNRFRQMVKVEINEKKFTVESATDKGFIRLRCRREVIVITPTEIIRRWRIKDGRLHYIRLNLVTGETAKTKCAEIV